MKSNVDEELNDWNEMLLQFGYIDHPKDNLEEAMKIVDRILDRAPSRIAEIIEGGLNEK